MCVEDGRIRERISRIQEEEVDQEICKSLDSGNCIMKETSYRWLRAVELEKNKDGVEKRCFMDGLV